MKIKQILQNAPHVTLRVQLLQELYTFIGQRDYSLHLRNSCSTSYTIQLYMLIKISQSVYFASRTCYLIMLLII